MENNLSRYDIEGLANELEVDIGDIATLFLNYFYEMKSEIVAIQQHLSVRNWNMLERVVHNIKGVSANLNVSDVYEEAAVFDILLKQNKTDDADIHVQKLARLLTNSEKEIREFFNEKGFSF